MQLCFAPPPAFLQFKVARLAARSSVGHGGALTVTNLPWAWETSTSVRDYHIVDLFQPANHRWLESVPAYKVFHLDRGVSRAKARFCRLQYLYVLLIRLQR